MIEGDENNLFPVTYCSVTAARSHGSSISFKHTVLDEIKKLFSVHVVQGNGRYNNKLLMPNPLASELRPARGGLDRISI